MFERFKSDGKAALRSLRRAPLLLFGAILTVAIAVGVNLAMLGVVDRALLAPPREVADPSRVFTLGFGVPGEAKAEASMTATSYVAFKTIRAEVKAFSEVAAFRRGSATVILEGDQRNADAMTVSGNYFDVLDVHAFLGSALDRRTDAKGAEPVVVLSDAFWRAALASDPRALGRRLSIDGLDYTVAGVMPAGFSGHSTNRVDLWIPFAAAMRATPGWDEEAFRNVAGVVARLAPDQNVTGAITQAATVLQRPISLHAIAGSEVASSERRVAIWLLGVSLLILVIGLANAATLLAVRGARMRRDMAIRSALGASKKRLLIQTVMEAVVIASTGTVVALIAASFLDETVRRVLFPDVLTRTGTESVTLWAAALGGILIGLVASAASALQLPTSGRGTQSFTRLPSQPGKKNAMSALLVVQTTLSVLLLAGAFFFGTSLYRLWAQDFGLRMDGALVIDFEPGPAVIAAQDAMFGEALEQIRKLPGVTLATPIDSIPFSGFNVPPISVPGRSAPPAVGGQLPYLTAATPDFLRILGIDVVEGRSFNEADDRGALVVLVNQSMARGVWPGESAVGKCIRIGFDPDFNPETFDPSAGPPMPSNAVPCREVVGVTRDVRQRSVLPQEGEDRLMQYFVPFSQVPVPPFATHPIRVHGLLLRTTLDAATLAPTLRRLVMGARTDLPYLRVRPFADLLERQMRPWTIGTRLLGLFSAIALLVAAAGLYAAFAHAVSERAREMAIRLAVGGRPRQVFAMVLKEALGVAGLGASIGCAFAIMAGRSAQTLLFGTTPSDPIVLGAAAMTMVLLAGLSTLRPALSASRAEPGVLLRSE